MNKRLVLWSITVGLGGFLFGLDVAVISGAEQAIQKLWGLSDWLHGTTIAMALYGTAFGAALGNIPANKIGRKKTLIWIGILFFITSLGAALSTNVWEFMFFRFLSGLSIGASSVVAPVYISEIAPPKYRGRMVISFQLNVVSGILIAVSFNGTDHHMIVYYIFLFIASHAIGQGAVIWVFLSELFPNSVRAAVTSFGSLTHWVFAALVAQVFPFFATNVSGTIIFGFFSFMMALQLLYVWKMMPETKGMALEDMESNMVLH
jgi:MFS family permease